MDIDKLTTQIMAECAKDGEPVTEEEAREMAEMELKAHRVLPNAKADKPKVARTRTTKVSDAKIELFNTIVRNLDRCDGVLRENITILKENKLICVKIGGETFKIDIIQERKAK